ncbi:MAG: hypothetical protein ACP5O7_11610 [Phycisphaerae bacterium]
MKKKLRFCVTAAAVVAGTTVVAAVAVVHRMAMKGPVAELQAALRQADSSAHLSGYPRRGWPDPYRLVLTILHREGDRLPPIWWARSFAHYAAYMGGLDQNYVGQAAKVIPHPSAWYRARKTALLRRAVSICPQYANGWAMLAASEQRWIDTPRRAKMDIYMERALQADPLNPYANALRAIEIVTEYGGHGPAFKHSHIFRGDFGFSSPRWAKVFCYRALVYMKYRNPRVESRMFFSYVNMYRTALKYYEPRELALLDAGVWKPGPCPDPWPPAATKNSAPASKAAATQAPKPVAAGNEK